MKNIYHIGIRDKPPNFATMILLINGYKLHFDNVCDQHKLTLKIGAMQTSVYVPMTFKNHKRTAM